MRKTSILILISILYSCANTRVVKPLPKGKTEFGITYGGPTVGLFGIVMPVPMTSVYGAYGINDSLTIHGGINGTAMLFKTALMDLGATYQLISPYNNKKIGLSVGVVANLAIDSRERNFNLYPQFDANIYKFYRNEKGLFYVGTSNWFVLKSKTIYDQDQPSNWIPNLQIGTRYSRPKLTYGMELKYLALNYPNDRWVVDYKGLGKKGSFGLYLSLCKRF